MSQTPMATSGTIADHLTWVRTRMTLDQELIQSIRHGFTLIAAGFGSFSIFEGLTMGERGVSELPKTFALVMTVVGIAVILFAVSHERKMSAWVDADEFAGQPVPELPDERRSYVIAAAAVIIGIVSFIALLRLP